MRGLGQLSASSDDGGSDDYINKHFQCVKKEYLSPQLSDRKQEVAELKIRKQFTFKHYHYIIYFQFSVVTAVHPPLVIAKENNAIMNHASLGSSVGSKLYFVV